MKDAKTTKHMKATPQEQAQVAKDYGAGRHWGEDSQHKVEAQASSKRGWDGNKTSTERTDRVPDLPRGVVE